MQIFNFDHSFWSVNESDDHFASQEHVFDSLGLEVLESAFQGYNACIFAYGQTGSENTLCGCVSVCVCVCVWQPFLLQL